MKMKLNVPFYEQTTPLNCGPAALRMILAFLDRDLGLSELEKTVGIKENKGISTLQLATAAASLGYKTTFFSKQVSFNEEHMEMEFYQKYHDTEITNDPDKLVHEAKEAGVEIMEKTVTLKEFLTHVTKDSVPIVLLDWNVVNGKDGYQGHFVPVVGHDSNNIYVHNQGLVGTKEFMSIRKDLFDKARKSVGTDEDFLVVYRKE